MYFSRSRKSLNQPVRCFLLVAYEFLSQCFGMVLFASSALISSVRSSYIVSPFKALITSSRVDFILSTCLFYSALSHRSKLLKALSLSIGFSRLISAIFMSYWNLSYIELQTDNNDSWWWLEAAEKEMTRPLAIIFLDCSSLISISPLGCIPNNSGFSMSTSRLPIYCLQSSSDYKSGIFYSPRILKLDSFINWEI